MMQGHEMTWALAGRMTVSVILILGTMFGIAVLMGFRLRKISEDYPPIDNALDSYTESDDQQDYEEGTEPPRAA